MDKANLKDYTTSIIAVLVVVSSMATGFLAVFKNFPIPTLISVAFGSIIGYYFAKNE